METEFLLPRFRELPQLGLYSDQVVTLVNEVLSPLLPADEGGKKKDSLPFTASMLNNYVKLRILSAPVKKQYTLEQVATAIVLCVLKQVYSISEISALISFALDSAELPKAYDRFCTLFEQILVCTREKKDYATVLAADDTLYLLKNVLISCSAKFFVKEQLKKQLGGTEKP